MQDHLVLRVVARGIIPFILIFGLYVQLHGEYSPGGGFQAGVIVASAFILYGLVFGLNRLRNAMPLRYLRMLGCIGMLLYAGIGVVSMILGGNYLDYNMLADSPVAGQKWGILLIELGVGITVFAVALLLFIAFASVKEPR